MQDCKLLHLECKQPMVEDFSLVLSYFLPSYYLNLHHQCQNLYEGQFHFQRWMVNKVSALMYILDYALTQDEPLNAVCKMETSSKQKMMVNRKGSSFT